MTAKGVPLWEVRDDRTLSAYAKLAYLMLWSRLPDARPAYGTLAADMGVSKSTAMRAVAELEAAGVLKKIPRLSEHGDRDANAYDLIRLEQGGRSQTPPQVPSDTTGGVPVTPKDSKVKTAKEGRNKSAGLPAGSRERERVTFTDSQIIEGIKAAVAEFYFEDIEVEDVRTLYWCFAARQRATVRDWRKYFVGVFERSNGAPLDSLLASSPQWCGECDEALIDCTCRQLAA